MEGAFFFRIPRNFPRVLSKEFMYVDVVNNRKELGEDTSRLKSSLAKQMKALDQNKLQAAIKNYGKVSTKKYFEELMR